MTHLALIRSQLKEIRSGASKLKSLDDFANALSQTGVTKRLQDEMIKFCKNSDKKNLAEAICDTLDSSIDDLNHFLDRDDPA